MGLLDSLYGASSGANQAVFGVADNLIGHPVAGLLNTFGADIKNRPITRFAQGFGLGLPAVNESQRRAQDIANVAANIGVGVVPGVGDVSGMHDDIKAVKESNYHPAAIMLAGAAALPFVPPLIRALPESVQDRLFQSGPSGRFGTRERGMLTFHGTPHTFEPTDDNPLGAFDHSKMGSGEGAQAYGWGTYLAENADVAKGYRDQLSDPSAGRLGDKSVYDYYKALEDKANSLPPDQASEVYEKMGFVEDLGHTHDFNESLERIDDEATRQWAEALRGEWKPPGNIYTVDLPDEHVAGMLDYDAPLSEQAPHIQDVLRPYASAYGDPKQAISDFLGTDYAKKFPDTHEVRQARAILEDPDYDVAIDGADWIDKQMRGKGVFYNLLGGDKGGALYERVTQSKAREEALEGEKARKAVMRLREITGLKNAIQKDLALDLHPEHADEIEEIYKAIDATHTLNRRNPQQRASEFLSSKGIPGIKFLDQGSRASGDGTRNFVVFDPSITRILQKN